MDNDGQEALVQMVEIISDIWMDSFSYCYDVLKEDSIAEACAESVTRIIVDMLNDGTIDIGYAQEENAPITEDQFREFWERLGALAEKKGDGDDNSDESDS